MPLLGDVTQSGCRQEDQVDKLQCKVSYGLADVYNVAYDTGPLTANYDYIIYMDIYGTT